MSDITPRTISVFGLTCESDEVVSTTTGVDERMSDLIEIVVHILEREQRRLARHSEERRALTERLLLLEEQVAALVVVEHS
jgi:hypothetical protein